MVRTYEVEEEAGKFLAPEAVGEGAWGHGARVGEVQDREEGDRQEVAWGHDEEGQEDDEDREKGEEAREDDEAGEECEGEELVETEGRGAGDVELERTLGRNARRMHVRYRGFHSCAVYQTIRRGQPKSHGEMENADDEQKLQSTRSGAQSLA